MSVTRSRDGHYFALLLPSMQFYGVGPWYALNARVAGARRGTVLYPLGEGR